MKKILITLILLWFSQAIFAQYDGNINSTDTLEALLVTKAKQLDSLNGQLEILAIQAENLQGEVTKLSDQITPYPRWTNGLSGTFGFNLSNYNDWLSKDIANLSSATIGFSTNGFVELEQKKYLWRNTANLNLGWLKFDNKDTNEDNTDFQATADIFNLSSLFGWKIAKNLALSFLVDYRTSILDGKFNNPGYIDIGGGGLTWTPSPNFRVVAHSLNYNWVISKEERLYESSLGTKIVADYTQLFPKGMAWKSNLSLFLSYKDVNNLSNWTWTNNFSTAIKGIGVGFDLGLRGSKQEAIALGLADNPVQIFWILGVTYGLSRSF